MGVQKLSRTTAYLSALTWLLSLSASQGFLNSFTLCGPDPGRAQEAQHLVEYFEIYAGSALFLGLLSLLFTLRLLTQKPRRAFPLLFIHLAGVLLLFSLWLIP